MVRRRKLGGFTPADFAETAPAAPLETAEAAAAGGERDITAGWVSALHRPNQDPVLAARGGGLELYEELLRDASVQIAFQQRQLALVGKPLEVVAGAEDRLSKKAAQDLEAQLGALPWDSITERMLYGRIYGYAAAECMYQLQGSRVVLAKVQVRKARRFLFGPEGDLRLRTRQRPYGEPLPARKFWVYSSGGDVTDDPYGAGLGQILYWLVWFKRNDLKLWLQALDKYASPTALGEFPPGTPQDERDKLLQTLLAIRQNSALAVPAGFAVRLLEAAKTGGADYSEAYKMLDEAITMVIAGQTMTSRDGSSRAQGEVHERVLDAIVKADDDLLSDSFNAGPARWLTEWNFPGAAPPKIRRQVEPPEDLDALADLYTKLKGLGFEPSEALIQEKFGPEWTKAAPQTPPPGLTPPGLMPVQGQETVDGGAA
jgi:phage gp29-like protein